MTDTAERRTRPYARRMAPEDRREQLLDAVLRVIVKQGVHKVSMDSVAKEAGVTRPVVYGHFTDSNDLLRGSLAREEEAALAQLATVLPASRDGSPADAAVASLARFLEVVQEAPERWLAILSLVDSSTPQLRARVEAGQQLMTAAFEDLVRWAMTDGLAPDTDVEVLARMLYAMLWDAGRLVLTDPETFPAERLVGFARYAVDRYLGPR